MTFLLSSFMERSEGQQFCVFIERSQLHSAITQRPLQLIHQSRTSHVSEKGVRLINGGVVRPLLPVPAFLSFPLSAKRRDRGKNNQYYQQIYLFLDGVVLGEVYSFNRCALCVLRNALSPVGCSKMIQAWIFCQSSQEKTLM